MFFAKLLFFVCALMGAAFGGYTQGLAGGEAKLDAYKVKVAASAIDQQGTVIEKERKTTSTTNEIIYAYQQNIQALHDYYGSNKQARVQGQPKPASVTVASSKPQADAKDRAFSVRRVVERLRSSPSSAVAQGLSPSLSGGNNFNLPQLPADASSLIRSAADFALAATGDGGTHQTDTGNQEESGLNLKMSTTLSMQCADTTVRLLTLQQWVDDQRQLVNGGQVARRDEDLDLELNLDLDLGLTLAVDLALDGEATVDSTMTLTVDDKSMGLDRA